MKKQVPNFENYTVYDTGDVINETTGKKLQGKIRHNGYRVYTFSKNGIKKEIYAQRLVAELFIDNPDNYPVVNHKDGNKLNNDVSNLEWVTYAENAKHAHDNKLIKPRRLTEYYKEDLPGEEWRVKEGFENYLISNKGRVMNKNTKVLLKPSITCGYYKVRLSVNSKVFDFMVHNLVFNLFATEATIPQDYVIDHIDGNKLNNEINNLRCISQKENALAAFYESKTNSAVKAVEQYSKNGEYIASFPSTREAGRQLKLDSSSISKVCRGKVKTCGGFVFKYKT